jgi:hypothetical protein
MSNGPILLTTNRAFETFLLAAREFATMLCCTPLYRQSKSFHAALSEWNQKQAQKKTDDLVRGRSTILQDVTKAPRMVW